MAMTAAAAWTGSASAQEEETPWYLSDGLSREGNAIIGIDEGGEYPAGEEISFYAAGEGDHVSILNPGSISDRPYTYTIRGTKDDGGQYEYPEQEFDDASLSSAARVLGIVPALEPGNYVLSVNFNRWVFKKGANDCKIGNSTEEVSFRVTDKAGQEEETLSVLIDTFLVDDMHIRALDLIAKELGMRLKISGMLDNDITSDENGNYTYPIDIILQKGRADIAVGNSYCIQDNGAWIHDLACSRTYLPNYVAYVKKDSGISSVEDLAGKTVFINVYWEGNEIWPELWGRLEGETICYFFAQSELESALSEGNVDAVVEMEYDINEELLADSGFEILPEAVLESGYQIAVAPEKEELIGRINQAIDALEESGKLQEIAAMHFGWDAASD